MIPFLVCIVVIVIGIICVIKYLMRINHTHGPNPDAHDDTNGNPEAPVQQDNRHNHNFLVINNVNVSEQTDGDIDTRSSYNSTRL